jgi:hypothetical protein
MLRYIIGQHIGWIRIFGYGIAWKNHRSYPALFSERYGYCRTLHLGDWCLRWLKLTRANNATNT